MKEIKNIQRPELKTNLPGPKSRELMKFRDEYVPQAIYKITPIFIKRGEGAVVEDVDGNKLLDFAAGISVLNIGYSHPELVQAVREQAGKFFHSCFNVLPYESYVQLAKRLCEVTPGDFKKKVFFVNSGAESIENAIKLARKFTGKSDIICFEGCFHGRTLLTSSLNSKVKPFAFGFGPLVSGIHKLPFAYCYRCAYGLDINNCNFRCAERLNEILQTVTTAENVAAVLLEPIQGEGGFIVPPNGFIDRIKQICEENNILLIADEVQSGFYRSGKMFASEYWNVAPDIIVAAKSISGGLPLAAVIARSDIMDSVHNGGVGGTFGGNPLSCVAGIKVVEIMKRDNFGEKAQKIGNKILIFLNNIKDKYEIIGDVRGRGAMIGFELITDRKSKKPSSKARNIIVEECYKNGLVIIGAGLFNNFIRIFAPLVATEEQVEEALIILEKAISKANNTILGNR